MPAAKNIPATTEVVAEQETPAPVLILDVFVIMAMTLVDKIAAIRAIREAYVTEKEAVTNSEDYKKILAEMEADETIAAARKALAEAEKVYKDKLSAIGDFQGKKALHDSLVDSLTGLIADYGTDDDRKVWADAKVERIEQRGRKKKA